MRDAIRMICCTTSRYQTRIKSEFNKAGRYNDRFFDCREFGGSHFSGLATRNGFVEDSLVLCKKSISSRFCKGFTTALDLKQNLFQKYDDMAYPPLISHSLLKASELRIVNSVSIRKKLVEIIHPT